MIPLQTQPVARSAATRDKSRLAALWALLLVLLLIIAGCGSDHELSGTLYDPVIPAPELEGTNWDGAPFRLSDLQGRVALIFFGYTSCPDICPLALSEMKTISTRLGDQAGELAVVFVSVDPERDSPERIGAYMQAFNEQFFGVHIPLEQLAAVKQDFGVYAEKRVVEGSAAGYLVDHTGWTYVVDKAGKLREVFATDVPVEARLQDVIWLMKRS